MKKLRSILAAALLFGAANQFAFSAAQISVDFFHDALDAYGDWREVGSYGYCWQPRDVDPDWRPYGDGHWIYTDAGWTWDSEEPYSWAVYHYGRWARVENIGWVWAPGTEWGPAWVSWRRGAKHVGWAPLPPEARFERSSGFSHGVDADYDIGPSNYSFVEVRNFGAPRLRTVFVRPQENITIINETANITKVTYVNNVIYNEGPKYDVISRETAQPIRRLKLDRHEDFDGDIRSAKPEQFRARVEGESFRVIALPVDMKPAAAPKRLAAKVQVTQIDHGWKNAGPAAEVARLRTKVKTEAASPAPVEAVANVAQPAEPPKRNAGAAGMKKGADQQPVVGDAANSVQSAPPVDQAAKPGKQKGKKPASTEAVPAAPAPAPVAPTPQPVAPDGTSQAQQTPAPDAGNANPGNKKGKGKKNNEQRPPAPSSVPAETQVPEASPKPRKGDRRNEAAESAGPLPVQSEDRRPRNADAEMQRPRQPAPVEAGSPKPKQEKGPGRGMQNQPVISGSGKPERLEPRSQEKRPEPVAQPDQQGKKGRDKDKEKDEKKREGAPQ